MIIDSPLCFQKIISGAEYSVLIKGLELRLERHPLFLMTSHDWYENVQTYEVQKFSTNRIHTNRCDQ